MPSVILSKNIKHPNTFSISQGKTLLASEIRAINQSIRLILTSARGELFGDPNFGSRLHEYLFDFIGSDLSRNAKEEISQVLQAQEPRIIISPDDITTSSKGNTVYINITYQIRYTEYKSTYQHEVQRQEGR